MPIKNIAIRIVLNIVKGPIWLNGSFIKNWETTQRNHEEISTEINVMKTTQILETETLFKASINLYLVINAMKITNSIKIVNTLRNEFIK